jgi:hypothetical protein
MERKIYIERDIEKDIVKWLESREIIAIRGPRQSGKTTLLNRLIEILNNKGISEKEIHLISMEDDFEKEKFEKNPAQYIEYYLEENKKHFFLIDEVQYVKNAGKILKLLFDSYDIKIIVTGSSTLDLNQLGKFLVGRVLFFELYPFSFIEFLKAKDELLYRHYLKYSYSLNEKVKKSIYLDKINQFLKEYLTFGGYPRIVLEKSVEKKKILLRNLFITYLEKDIVGLYGLKYKQKVIDLVKYLASVMGSIIKYEDICSTTHLYFKEMKEILNVLEDTYIIKIVKPFHKNLITELKKNPKIYFIDTGLRNMIINKFEFQNEEYGSLLEGFVLNLLRSKNISYWRTTSKAEVDFVLSEKIIPIEVKTRPKTTKSLRSFIKQYKPKFSIIPNLKEYGEKKINSTKIIYVPVAFIRSE